MCITAVDAIVVNVANSAHASFICFGSPAHASSRLATVDLSEKAAYAVGHFYLKSY